MFAYTFMGKGYPQKAMNIGPTWTMSDDSKVYVILPLK